MAPLDNEITGSRLVERPIEAPTIIHDGRAYRVTRRDEHFAYIDAARKLPQARIGEQHASQPASLPASCSLAQYQTPIKDQKDRGTCWAFAGAAAVEAAYKRKYNITLDLSEQYIAHMEKVQELYNAMASDRTHENNSTLWDGQGASDIIIKMSQSAVPPEVSAPYMTQVQLNAIQAQVPGGNTITSGDQNPLQSVMDSFELRSDLIPPAARTECRYQVARWADPGAYNSATFQAVIAGGHEVAVDITLDWAQDSNGIYQYNANVSGGGHCLLLIGYDDSKQCFTAKNSWGGTSYIEIGYGFIDKCCGWAHYVTDVLDPQVAAQKRAFWVGIWNMDHDGWRGTLDLRRTIDYRASDINAPTRLGVYTRDGVQYDVNGYFGEGGQQCTFYIASDGNRVQPGTLSGQRFDLYCFSWDINHAAGRTSWNNTPFGALISRPALPAERLGKFNVENWIGSYQMNHDGWHGTLRVTSVAPFAATYTDAGGKQLQVEGSIKDHELSMSVAFPGNIQQFDLLYHTWELGVFSGTTVWNGTTFGVIGLPGQ